MWNFEDFKEIAEKNGGECLRVIEGKENMNLDAKKTILG